MYAYCNMHGPFRPGIAGVYSDTFVIMLFNKVTQIYYNCSFISRRLALQKKYKYTPTFAELFTVVAKKESIFY